MSAGEVALIVIKIFGGLAFFIYGMKVVSESLQALAGRKLREWLFKVTRSRWSGLLVGTSLGFTIHSGATTVLLLTFINAGMMSLLHSMPVMLGANVGTTLSMQLVSFKIGKYALAAVAVGILLKLGARRATWAQVGSTLFGFGMLFLGMETMSEAVIPLKHSPVIQSILLFTDARSIGGYLLSLLLSVLITALFQSSGATIGVVFALCSAGVFTDLAQAFPLILGAHIGTCSATLLGAVGTNVEARRSAASHLLFNVLGTVAASLMAPLYVLVIPKLGGDLMRQVANTHTIVQTVNSLIVLPLTPLFTKLVIRLTPSDEQPPEQSHLDEDLLITPERAIAGAMRETRRMAAITRRMLVQAMAGLLKRTTQPFTAVLKEEAAVDTLKRSVNAYLFQIATRKLSTRQSILLQHLMATAAELERIGDHIETVVKTTQDKVSAGVWFDEESMRLLVEQYQRVDKLLRLTILSLDPDLRAFRQISARMLQERTDFVQWNRALRARYRQRIVDKLERPLNGIYYEQYLRCFERIVRHTKVIAQVEQRGTFKVKPQKFARTTSMDSRPNGPIDRPLPVDERMLNEELTFDDLGIDSTLLVPTVAPPPVKSTPPPIPDED